MKIILILLTPLIYSGVNASEIDTSMETQTSHIEASRKLFQFNDEKSRKEGFDFLLAESKAGSAFSTGKIGWAYQMGWGVKKDTEKAKSLYISAAESGMTYWQYLLAHSYQQGYLGFTKSEEKYKYWLNYQPKVHIAKYECWVAYYYEMGIFPENELIHGKNRKSCNER